MPINTLIGYRNFSELPLLLRKNMAVTSGRHDYLPLIETLGYLPPVAFESFERLDFWRLKHGMSFEKKWEYPISVVIVKGHMSIWPYRQVWAHIKSDHFRKGIEYTLRDFFLEGEKFSDINADHVIARTRFKGCHDAWLNIFPVWGQANQNFGWIEGITPEN